MINNFESPENRFLSNFYNSPLEYKGIKYPTIEHAFQAQKTTNKTEQLQIANQETPGQAKRLGRKVKMISNWEEIKEQVMYDLVKIKFSNPSLKQKLLNTGEEELIEGNTWNDVFWGVCNGVGKNRLGNILMKVRSELKG